MNISDGGQAFAEVPVEHAELARRLRTAEDRLFPLAMVDADRYQWSVLLVARLAADLGGTVETWDDLASAGPRLVQVLPTVAGDLGIPLAPLDPELVVEAAMAQQLRRLMLREANNRQKGLVEAAREAGQVWAVLEEPDPAALLHGAAQWVEVHTRTGSMLIRTVSTDPATNEPRYRLRLVRAGTCELEEEHHDRGAWTAAAEVVRRSVDIG